MATTPEGVAQQMQAPPISTEDAMQSLFDRGAFEPEKPKTEDDGRGADGRFAKTEAEAPAQEQKDAPKQEAQPAEGEKPAEGEEEGEDYDSLDSYLAKHQLDPESFQSLPVTVKINGETKQIPLKDVIKSYQLEGHVQNKSQELAQQRQQFETERQSVIELHRQQLIAAHNMLQMSQQTLLKEFQGVDWQKVQQEDPVRFMLLRQQYSDRQAEIQQGLQQVTQAHQAEAQKLQQQQAALLPQEQAKMLEAIPQWKDAVKLREGMTQIAGYARNLGFSDAEMNSIFDHRYMQVLHDAAQFRALQAANPQTLKRVRAAPQMGKPGARNVRDPKTAARNQAQERFKANPQDLDAQAAYFETLLE